MLRGAKAPEGSSCGDHLKGQAVRGSYLGFDLYTYGPLNTARKVRALQRSHRLPPRLDGDVKAALPTEFFWPTSSHEEVHRCIDAIFVMDADTLSNWKRQYPEHHFGFEPFIEFIHRWRADRRRQKRLGEDDRPDTVHGAEALIAQAAKDPEAARVGGSLFPAYTRSVRNVKSIEIGDYSVRVGIATFGSGSPALSLDVYPMGVLRSHQSRLSRVYADLETGEFEVIEHFPGKYAGAGLDPRFLRALLGSGAAVEKRKTIWDDPRVRAAHLRQKAEAERNKPQRMLARETADKAREMYGEGDAAFASHLLPAGVTR